MGTIPKLSRELEEARAEEERAEERTRAAADALYRELSPSYRFSQEIDRNRRFYDWSHPGHQLHWVWRRWQQRLPKRGRRPDCLDRARVAAREIRQASGRPPTGAAIARMIYPDSNDSWDSLKKCLDRSGTTLTEFIHTLD